MTEAEWLAGTGPDEMSYFVITRANDRKMRLFTVACCRRIWHLLSDPRSRHAVEVAERYAEGEVTSAELAEAQKQAGDAYQDGSDAFYGLRSDVERPHSVAPHGAAIHVADPPGMLPSEAARSAAYAVFHNVRPFSPGDADAAARPEQVAQAVLLRCVVGNPFRPATTSPSWLTSTVVALARQMYESRDFAAMPILGDALQDAGCTNEDVLSHCRDTSLSHVRGCWVVDLLLGKG